MWECDCGFGKANHCDSQITVTEFKQDLVRWNSPRTFFQSFWKCHRLDCLVGEHVHDLVFAGHMLLLALSTPPTPTFNPLEFAQGFASHMLVDSVGFHANGLVSLQSMKFLCVHHAV